MEDAVFTVSPQAKGAAIVDILAEQNVGSVPVVEEDRTLVGLVSGAPRLYSRGPCCIFGETRRSMSSFAKASARRPKALADGSEIFASFPAASCGELYCT
ncbi:MAG: CBS domain-containing protein [Nitrospira defluvii]|nr:CBS domain-containing protein [Nitrospira defluvii]